MPKRVRDENLAWNEVDTDTLKAPAKKLYLAYKEAQAEASTKRQAFDEAFEKTVRSMPEVISEEQSLLITHKFGKLSFAVSDEPPTKSGSKSKKFAFS